MGIIKNKTRQIKGQFKMIDMEGVWALLIIGGVILDYWWEKIFQVGAFYLFYRMLKAGETVIYSTIKERDASLKGEK